MLNEIWHRFYIFEQRIRPYIPFTALNTVWWHLDKNSVNIVDVGCGEGIPAKFLRRHRHAFMLGLDIFLPSILTARKNGCHDQYIQADVRYLPIAEKSFDVVMSMEVLEHLDRQEGLDFLQALERIARRQVIVTTPEANMNKIRWIKTHINYINISGSLLTSGTTAVVTEPCL